MENWKLYVDLGYGIPQYAVMEILRAMRDKAEPDENSIPTVMPGPPTYFVSCPNGFHIEDTHALGLCLLANARCVGLNVSALNVESNENGSLGISFI